MGDFEQLAEDLAAASQATPEEAAAAMAHALRGEMPPIRVTRKAPWWWRLPIPLLWKQKMTLRRLNKTRWVGKGKVFYE